MTMKVTVMSVLLCFLLSLVEMHAQTFPYMVFNATILPNHTYVDYNLVRNTTDESVKCRTNLTTCNNVSFCGDWYFPNGMRLPVDAGDSDVHVYEVHKRRHVLLRRQKSPVVSGIYRCDIESKMVNNKTINETLYAGLYTSGGDVTIDSMELTVDSDLYGETPQFTLTCISTGGPATNVTWNRNSNEVLMGVTVLNNTVTAQYTHTLTVTGRQEGQYQCTVSNEKPSTATANFTVQAALAPTNLMAFQEGVTGIRVSWTPPTPLEDTKGYRIYYSGGSSGSVDVSGGSTHDYLLSGLINGMKYNISIVGTSKHLPSNLVSHPNRIPLIPLPEKPSVLMVTSSTSTNMSLTWIVRNHALEIYELVWERDNLEKCPMKDNGSIITNGSINYTITGLEEYSNYTITVAAINAAGSTFSDPITGMTQEAAPSAPPTPVHAPDVSSSSITVHWGAIDCIYHNGDITGYSVRYGVEGSGSMKTLNVSGGSTTKVTISGLINATTYAIEVAAVNSAGIGEYSAPITVETDTNDIEGDGREQESGSGIEAAAVGISAVLIVMTLFVLLVITGLWWWKKRKLSKDGYSPTSMKREESDAHHLVQENTVSAPDIIKFPEETHAVEGESVLFQLKVTGSPTPKLTWYHNGEEVSADYSRELAEDGTLTLPSVEVRQGGIYKLVAQNSAGKREMEVRLHVETEYNQQEQATTKPFVKLSAIAVAFFGNHVEKNHCGNNQIFRDEYKSLYNGNDKSMTMATTPHNKLKNRFAKIYPYDDNRVVLRPVEGYDNDYINASIIDGYSVSRKYIATQGPLSETVVDFWRMVWQERAPSIVMITNLEEGGKPKCQQYWPDSGTENYGCFHVSIINQQTLADYTIHELTVKLSSSSERALKVTHFHFTAWPDHGVPDYATPILAFHRRVKKEHKPSKGPMVVHCSAGVGRTGTFVTIDCVLEQIEKQGMVDIPGVIQKIRKQRVNMVQALEQYIFIHDAVLESVTCGDTQIDAGHLSASLDNLLKKNQFEMSELEIQFALLDQVSLKASDAKCVAARTNPMKNRSMEFLPVDKWRVVLKGEFPDYINATNVHGYKHQTAFIITQGPMQSTARDFWKMVYDRKCRVIVMLSDLVEGGQEVCYQYWPSSGTQKSGTQKFGEFQVEVLGEERLGSFVLRTLCVVHSKSGNACQVSQFHITNWAPDGSCSNLKTVIDVIEEVSKVQRRTGNQPIVMHCSDTVSRCGMFCAIATTIERCKTEGVVDVFQVVKALRVQKPGAVCAVAQYQLVFEALIVYLDSFSTYANF